MNEAVIVATARSPIGRAYKGAFNDLHGAQLAAHAISHAVERARLAHDEFGREPLRFAHYATLCWVEHLGPCSQIELATAMRIDPSDLVTVLQALEAAGV